MRKSCGLCLLLALFAFGRAFALNVDSLPVWNPDYLVRYHEIKEFPIEENLNSTSNLETHGYKTMLVTVGDGGTQVDQELRLSVQGMVGDSVFIDALLSDVDREAGDQSTATLQEVDQVYFRAESKHWMIHLGDLTWEDESLGLSSVKRSTLGAMGSLRGGFTEVSGAIGTDKVNRIRRVLNGVSGQRDGYAISDDLEYLSVVPNSEMVWLNGNLLTRDVDYELNYAGGLLNFRGKRIPGPDDEIQIEYDAYENENVFNLYAANAHYRHPNVFLDVSGFRLENDRERMKRGTWTDEEYAMLKSDSGESIFRTNDSLPGGVDSMTLLNRPMRRERMGARLRLQNKNRYYADLEVALNKRDSNIVSDKVNGPEGNAYRWFLTSDSTEKMKSFPVAFSIYGNYIQREFETFEYQGSDKDWNSFRLKDEWDLDSSLISSGDLRHDEFGMRYRFGSNWFASTDWGYRRGENESWNSSRAKLSVLHRSNDLASDVNVVRVASMQEAERERYQASGDVEFLRGFLRPFGNFDLRYTEIRDRQDSENLDEVEDEVAYAKTGSGLSIVCENWGATEGVETKIAKRRGDSYGENWSDSLKSVVWNQTANWQSRYVDLNHFLQFERRVVDSSAAEQSWVGDFNSRFGDEEIGISGSLNYKLGLTEEQTYTSVYKAVAKGTGDVRYDSLSGTFIEGVDNGDFVYEGLGRNDSIGAVLASNSSFGVDVDLNPGLLLRVHEGILRDITLGGSYNAESEDTTGKKLYFPSALPYKLRKVSSGMIAWEARLEWNHPYGIWLSYKPGADYEKKLSSFMYFVSGFHQNIDLGFQINENHFVGMTLLLEDEELNTLQKLEWKTQDFSGCYRYRFLENFHVETGGRYRVGDGHDDSDNGFDAYLWEGSLRLGYDKMNVANAFVKFSAVQMESGDDVVPYQMMSGYSDGRTYRLEASASVDVNDFISFGLHYILRFGNAEENIFQKLSSEARAYF